VIVSKGNSLFIGRGSSFLCAHALTLELRGLEGPKKVVGEVLCLMSEANVNLGDMPGAVALALVPAAP
jgi:hypothetical protein